MKKARYLLGGLLALSLLVVGSHVSIGGGVITTFEGHDGNADGVDFGSDGQRVVSGSWDDPAKALRLERKEVTKTPGPNQEEAIEQRIDWSEDPSQLRELTELDLSEEGITDLSGMGNLGGLETLNLAENEIEDLSPLGGLEDLESLILSSNRIEDLSPLEKLANLEILWLHDNEITDLSPLLNLEELTYLRIEENPLDLTEGSQTMQYIRRLEERGVEVRYE